ncbi:MAG: polymer-forming cytoskeletal protein [Bacilli bacterium]
MKKKIFSLLIMLSLFIVAPVSAEEINDFHMDADDNVKLEDTVNGDSAIAGNLVDIIGNIDGIGFIAGQTVNVNGNLEYGFLAGQNVNINGNITKNVYSAGETITISKDATIGRDLFLAGNNIILNGNLQRNIRIYATNVTIEKDATIEGNITIEASNIKVEDGAVIKGTLKYNKDTKSDINSNSNIGKITTYEISDNKGFNTSELLVSLLNMIVVFLVITIIIPKTLDKTNELYEKKNNNYIKNIGIGFLILICVPLISLILLASNIGVYLGLIMALLYAIAIYLSFIISGYLLANLILVKLMKLKTNRYLSGIIGIIFLKILMFIPVLSTIICLIAITLGLATIWSLLQKDEKEDNKKDNKVTEAKIVEKKIEKEEKPKKSKTKNEKSK